MKLPRVIMLDKAVGETPLQCMEQWRAQASVPTTTPLTYAGRLDPMASGKLLVLIGEECKNKEHYLALDKTYEFSVLFGIDSDTHDVLGRVQADHSVHSIHPLLPRLGQTHPETVAPSLSLLTDQLTHTCQTLVGPIELPYPHFSSKTVNGKPLFKWSLEGRLDEIPIPTKQSTIYSLTLDRIETKTKSDVCNQARTKIDTIPEVTDKHKKLGADFRRTDVRADWQAIQTNDALPDQYTIAHFTCHCSSGTYMRTLAKLIGEQLKPPVPSLAWSIHRTAIDMH